MNYTVIVTNAALEQAEGAYLWLAQHTELHAPTWYNGLLDAINSLEEMPLRCPRVPGDECRTGEEHQLLYGMSPHVYRIIFIVRDQKVHVLEIIHGARDRQ